MIKQSLEAVHETEVVSGPARARAPAARAGGGSRARNKAEKRQRIQAAALRLFSQFGYEATTLRDVAREAQVALGTLSLYAQDKRDLVLLVFNERIGALTTRASKAAWKEDKLLDRTAAFFGTFYRDFNSNYTLARIFLQLNYYSTGIHGAEYLALRSRVAAEIQTMVDAARASGEIVSGESSDLIARHFFFVFSAAVRWWIAGPKPNLAAGLDDLRRLLRLQISGLQKAPEAGAPRVPSARVRRTPISSGRR